MKLPDDAKIFYCSRCENNDVFPFIVSYGRSIEPYAMYFCSKCDGRLSLIKLNDLSQYDQRKLEQEEWERIHQTIVQHLSFMEKDELEILFYNIVDEMNIDEISRT